MIVVKKYFPLFSTRSKNAGRETVPRWPEFCYIRRAMQKLNAYLTALILLLCAGAAGDVCQAQPRPSGTPMFFEVVDGDTIYVDVIQESRILSRGRRRAKVDWRQYYKLVYNFNKVYPYAIAGRSMMAQVDSTIEADVTRKSQRAAYINDVERELFRLFEKDIRNMTISQGMVLLRLVDRECGMCGYDIIKTYESGFAANFWQMVARIFSHNLKTRYDPNGEDWQIEELVYIWDSGQWDNFYMSIFGELPKKTVVRSSTLNSSVKK